MILASWMGSSWHPVWLFLERAFKKRAKQGAKFTKHDSTAKADRLNTVKLNIYASQMTSPRKALRAIQARVDRAEYSEIKHFGLSDEVFVSH